MRKGYWLDHPELLSLQKKYRKCKVTAEEVAEIKAELEAEKRVEPVVRVIEEKVEPVIGLSLIGNSSPV